MRYLLLLCLPLVAQVQTPLTVYQSSGTATGEIRLQERRTNGTNHVGLAAPQSVAADLVWTLPATDGTNGQALVTNGSGVLSWASGAGGWTISGSNVYRDTGIVTVGATSPTVRLGQNFNTNTASDFAGMAINTWSATGSHGSVVDFNKSGSGTIGSHAAVASGDTLGFFVFRGSDGTAFQRAADVNSEVDAAVSSGVVPGRLRFRTANTSGTMVERWRIDSSGHFLAGADNSWDIGASGAFRPRNLYVAQLGVFGGAVSGSGFDAIGGSYSVGGVPVISNSRELGNIQFVATNLIPSITTTYNIGSSTYRWNNLWAQAFDFAGGGTITGNVTMSGTTNTMSGTMRPGFDGLGSIGNSTYKYGAVHAYDVVAASNLWVSSSVVINFSRNLVGLNAVAQALPFSVDNTYDIGSSGANRPRNLYVAGAGTFGSTVTGGSFNTASGGGYSINGTLIISNGRELGNITGVGTNLIPSLTTTYNLGNSTYRWTKLWAQDFDFSGGGTFTGNVVMSGTTNTMSGTMRPGFDGLGSIGNSSYKYGAMYTYNADFSGTITAPNGNTGWSGTRTVRAAGGAADCTLIYSGGLLTGGTC